MDRDSDTQDRRRHMHRFVEVVFNIPVDKTFLYSVSENATLERGCRVVAPLGKRQLTGFVVSETTDSVNVD